MRIVSWNMGCGGKQSAFRKTHEEAWNYALDTLGPDIAFVQETLGVAREWLRDRGELLMSADQNADNGAALFVRSGLTATPLILRSPDAFIAAADVAGQDGSLRVASLHLYPRSGARHQANLAALFDGLAASLRGERFVVGGDINAARRFDEVYGGKRYASFFASAAERGFHDCHFGLHAKEEQSFWGHSAKEAYQLDHLFVDAVGAKSVRACDVATTAETRRLSDHSPMVLEFD